MYKVKNRIDFLPLYLVFSQGITTSNALDDCPSLSYTHLKHKNIQ